MEFITLWELNNFQSSWQVDSVHMKAVFMYIQCTQFFFSFSVNIAVDWINIRNAGRTKKLPLLKNNTVDIPLERPGMLTNRETKQFLCSVAGLWSSSCLRVLVLRVLLCFFRQCVLDYSWALIKHCKWKSQHLPRPWNTAHTQTKANTDVHVPVVGTMVMSVCQYTHMAISNWSSHFFFSSLVLKNSSKPVCPCWWVT